jgi:putative FmdB family regulatory protein
MPVYEYRCPECTSLFEKRVSFADAAADAARDVPCPNCGTSARKLLSTFAAIGVAGGSESGARPAPTSGGGGCCGGGCCGG